MLGAGLKCLQLGYIWQIFFFFFFFERDDIIVYRKGSSGPRHSPENRPQAGFGGLGGVNKVFRDALKLSHGVLRRHLRH